MDAKEKENFELHHTTMQFLKQRLNTIFISEWSFQTVQPWLGSFNGYYSKIVLVAIQDDGSKYVKPALDALKRLGATDPILVTFRGSFALAGFSQADKPYWITQEQHERYKGPSSIRRSIPLKQSRPPRKYLVNSCHSSFFDCGTE